jgi:site-specific recombinase XerD
VTQSRTDLAIPTGTDVSTDRDEWGALTAAWLGNRRLAANTRLAYHRDVTEWLTWCRVNELHPLTLKWTHVNTYARRLEEHDGAAPTTVARKLSAVSSWYQFLVKLEAATTNPVAKADRPRVDRDHSATVGLTLPQVHALLAAAEERRPGSDTRDRDRVILTLLADLGLRISEVTGANVEDLGHDRDHRVLSFVGKGGKPRRRSLDPGTSVALDRYLASRGDPVEGPMFVTDSGRRIDRAGVARMLRSVARRAGIPQWRQISPHSLRHTFATAARDEGVPLEEVQDAMGHADPRTTRRYDRDRNALDRDPSHAVWRARVRAAETTA